MGFDRRLLAIFTLLAVAGLPLFAGGEGEGGAASPTAGGAADAVDYLGVAAVMLRDGNFERAEAALSQIDPAADGVDRARYYTLGGLLRLRQGRFAEAAEALEQAAEEGQGDATIYVYLAQAYYASEQFEAAIDSIDRVPNLNQFPALYGVLAESEWRLGRSFDAFATLDRAISLFPSQTQFQRQRIFYLIELDLTQEASEASVAYLERLEDDPDAYIAIGEALRRGGNPLPAIATLERARLTFGGSERLYLALAAAYLDAGQDRNAGMMVERAAGFNFALYSEAAEIFRRAGDMSRALFLNSLVVDETAKTRQRFNILMSSSRYEEALALESRLQRNGSLDDDNLKYAVAYALFQTGQFDRASIYLNQIASAEVFRQATQLRRAIETVRAQDFIYF